MIRSAKRNEFLSYVLITAVEGGINYWTQVSGYHPEDADPEKIGVTVWPDADDFEPEEFAKIATVPGGGVRVTLDTIASAIAKMRANKDGKFAFAHNSHSYWVQFWLADRTNGEDGDYDAGIADCIVQVAVLGDVVYG